MGTLRYGALLLAALLALPAPARAGDDFLDREAGVVSAYTYPYSDGGEPTDEVPEEGYDVFIDGDDIEPPAGEPEPFELWGPFELRRTAPFRQLGVAGPTYRNVNNREEIGFAWGYVNNMFPAVPFQMSLENSMVRQKHIPTGQTSFRGRTRLASNAQFWRRRSRWEATAVAATFFWQNQTASFNTIELGGAVSEVIGQRLTISGNLIWRRRYLQNGDILDAPVWSFGTSYNFGAGWRFGGFYELWNSVDRADDWGAFLSWQALPFMEIIADGGNNDFIRGRLVFSYALDR